MRHKKQIRIYHRITAFLLCLCMLSSTVFSVQSAAAVTAYENVVLNKPVQASSEEAANLVKNINDGSSTSRWAASDVAPQNVMINLQGEYLLHQFDILFYNGTGVKARAYQYNIFTSMNGEDWDLCVDESENDIQDRVINEAPADTKAGYIKIEFTGCTNPKSYPSVYEIKVLGERIDDPNPDPVPSESFVCDFKELEKLPEDWTIKNPTEGGVSFDGSGAVIHATEPDGAAKTQDQLMLDIPISGDWTAETHFTLSRALSAKYEKIGIYVYTDESNWLMLDQEQGGDERIQVYWNKDGSVVHNSDQTTVNDLTDVYFRLVKNGGEFAFSYSTDGENYIYIGTEVTDGRFDDDVKLNLFASTTKAENPSFDATVEYFKLTRVTDNTPWNIEAEGNGVADITYTAEPAGEENQVLNRGTVTFHIAPKDGVLISSDTITVSGTAGEVTRTQNGDGTWTVVVPKVKSNVKLTVTECRAYKIIIEDNGVCDVTYTVDPVIDKQEAVLENGTVVFTLIPKEGMIINESNIGVEAVSGNVTKAKDKNGVWTITVPSVKSDVKLTAAECENFYYVSPDGDDSADGTEDAPFETVQMARDTIRALEGEIPAGGITVLLREGEYPQSEPLVFTPEDSGKAGSPIIYMSYPGETAVITGGVNVADWEDAGNDIPYMADAAKGHLMVADISDLGVVNEETGERFHDFYVDGKRQQMSSQREDIQFRTWHQFTPDQDTYLEVDSVQGTKVKFQPGEVEGLVGRKDIEVNLYSCMFWTCVPLVTDIQEDGTAWLKSYMATNLDKESNGFNKRNEGGWYSILNDIKYLDTPGEWCVNTEEGKMYYWPENKNFERAVVPAVYELIQFLGDEEFDENGDKTNWEKQVEYIILDNLTMEYSDRLREDKLDRFEQTRNSEAPDGAIMFNGAANCAVTNSIIRHTGSYAVALHNYAQNIDIIRNEMGDLGCGGVNLVGYGAGTTDLNKYNRVMYNNIHGLGRDYLHTAGVTFVQSGENTVQYNIIADAPYTGFTVIGVGTLLNGDKNGGNDLFGTNGRMHAIREDEVDMNTSQQTDKMRSYLHARNNLIDHNYIDEYMMMLEDGGGQYLWGCGGGNKYTNNAIVKSVKGMHWTYPIYIDDRVDLCEVSGTRNWSMEKGEVNKGNNRRADNRHSWPEKPAGYDALVTAIFEETDKVGGFIGEPVRPAVLKLDNTEFPAKRPLNFSWFTDCEDRTFDLEIATDEKFKNVVYTTNSEKVYTSEKFAEIKDLADGTYYARVISAGYLLTKAISNVVEFEVSGGSESGNEVAVNNYDGVLLQWKGAADTDYTILRAAGGEDYTVLAENVTQLSYFDNTVEAGETYTYVITDDSDFRIESNKVTIKKTKVIAGDDFSDAAFTGNQWEMYKGSGKITVEDGVCKTQGNEVQMYLHVPDEYNKDYAAEVKVKFIDTTDKSEDWNNFGLAVRREQHINFSQLAVMSITGEEQILRRKNNDWVKPEPFSKDVFDFTKDEWHTMRLEVKGDSLYAYIDNQFITSISGDNVAALGDAGFRLQKELLEIDDFKVIVIDEEAEEDLNNIVAEGYANGKIIVQEAAVAGDIVTFSVKPDAGYQLVEDSLSISGGTVEITKLKDGRYSFVMPDYDVDIAARFEKSELYPIGIEIVKKPDKMVYYVDEEFDPTGMVVEVTRKATSSNAEPVREVLDHQDLTFDCNNETPGKIIVTITYEEAGADGEMKTFTAQLTVKVYQFYTDHIKVEKKPKKLVYNAGDDFDDTGMEVVAYEKATPSSATRTVEVPLDELEYEGFDSATPGSKTVKIIYYGRDDNLEEKKFTAKVNVIVAEEPEEDFYTREIRVTKLPDKTTYKVGDVFKPEGMEVYAYKVNAVTGEVMEEAINDYTADKKVFMVAGNAKVTVSYAATDKNGQAKLFTDSFLVQVERKHTSSSGSSSDYTKAQTTGTWYQNETGWWFSYIKGGYAANKWENINNKWYYFNEAGYMETGWHLEVQDGYWYYLDPVSGIMKTGWIQVNGKWYYLNTNVTDETSWSYDATADQWRYVKNGNRPLGSMYKNEITPDGYHVDENGAWVK